MRFTLAADLAKHPRPADTERLARGIERFHEAADRMDDSAVRRFARDVFDDSATRTVLEAVFGSSPFLTQCIVLDIGFVAALFEGGPDQAFDTTLAELSTAESLSDNAAVGAALRKAKRRVALLTGLADIAGLWPLETVTERLSRFCDRALGIALKSLMRDAHNAGAIELPDTNFADQNCGLFVIGMGKLGAFELNYSSDIDLIVLYDEEAVKTAHAERLQSAFVRLTRNLVRLMDQRTGDGYVFRTDIRLRPDPGATPVAISTMAAETYYESLGQNWERAAMIKARIVAGDQAAGTSFLHALRPFVWRRHLDFAAIEDIQSIKRQIYAHKGGSTVAVGGHNIKLGRGGIREVEFFAQTQQLIWGGRDPSLRAPGTIDAIRALVAAERVTEQAASDMIGAYRFLRHVEHRLQMIDDQQTHSLPDDDAGLRDIAMFLGYPDRESFEDELLIHLRAVENHYAELFEESPSLSGTGVLVFTGAEDHPDTLNTLSSMGFSDTETISATIRGWHHGRYRATRSTRAREILTELMPLLLAALGRTASPDVAFRRFDELLAGLPAGVQLFSLFHANPDVLDLVAEVVGGSPRLAEILSGNPLLLDGVLDADFRELPEAAAMRADLDEKLGRAGDMQDVLDIARRWANDEKFRVGVQILRNQADIDRADLAFSDIADTTIRALLPQVAKEFAIRHGDCPGDGFAVLALGKLGGRELSATSDLDLVFLYDIPDFNGQPTASNGPKPLSLPHYYQRLSQRLINALTAMTGEGGLFEVDMRLRPSGNAGPLAVSLETFAQYQRKSAWTWEHLALTRARIVVAAPEFATRIDAAIGEALVAERVPGDLLIAVSDMRRRHADEHPANSVWQVKYQRGGLLDCEFICQYLQLLHAHENPDILDTGTVAAYSKLAMAGFLDRDTAEKLIEATGLWRRLQGLLRITIENDALPEHFPVPLRATLTAAAGTVDFAALEVKVQETADWVFGYYNQLIEEPADALRGSETTPG
ncbi:MAG: bifunctional [glutamine synthetase] adenylyltransferase/[glutamine synthetase]-adenylyl-L-tyrosine phosphorylase [Alphaproteobacteria bacterium]|nr:bifunctional [glutamine synthetase] adenylyltransferase/[glutamine synthetase]-adenylyl-L-tyrosine phosphorylase [Alphaproteobacteria bacterium]